MVRLPRTARDVLGWVRSPRQVLLRGAQLAITAPALTIAERQHIERVLGVGRVALCAAALASLASDPTWFGFNGQFVCAMLSGYALFGFIEVVGTSRRAWDVPSKIAHSIDVLVAIALTIATVNLPSRPFFLFFLFAVLGAAYRWGLGASLMTAVVGVIVFSTEYAANDVELSLFLMRGASLLIAAFVAGGLTELERQRRAKTAVVSTALERLQSRTSVHAAIRETADTVLAMFSGERLLAAVHDPATGASYAWTARRGRSRSSLTVREISTKQRAEYFFSAAGDAWHVETSADRFPDALRDGISTAVAAVDVNFPGQGAARVFMTRTRPLSGTELGFFRDLVCQIAPAIFSLYLVRRVRARATAAERARVARELHDGIIQALAGLRFDVAALRRHAGRARAVDAELARLEHSLAEQVIAARELMHRVRPLEVTPQQLPGYLGTMVERFTRETGIPAYYHTDVEETDLPPRACRELARTLQEALVNVRKHSGARHVVVRFSADPIYYRLTVDNDGRPFEFAGRLTLAELEAARRGPLVIKERVREMGGELVIESSPDRGVRLDILLRRRVRAGSSKTA